MSPPIRQLCILGSVTCSTQCLGNKFYLNQLLIHSTVSNRKLMQLSPTICGDTVQDPQWMTEKLWIVSNHTHNLTFTRWLNDLTFQEKDCRLKAILKLINLKKIANTFPILIIWVIFLTILLGDYTTIILTH